MFAEPVVQLRRWRRKETRVVIPGHHAAMNPESLYINTSGFRIQPCGLVWNDEHPHATPSSSASTNVSRARDIRHW